MSKNQTFRTEKDSLGEVKVPKKRYGELKLREP